MFLFLDPGKRTRSSRGELGTSQTREGGKEGGKGEPLPLVAAAATTATTSGGPGAGARTRTTAARGAGARRAGGGEEKRMGVKGKE